MADEMERDSPQSPSPPQIDDSPEVVNQPSPPEEGISSSTDRWIPETPASPDPTDEPRVSSTSEFEQNAGERSSTPSDSDASQEIENQSQPDGPPDHVIRHILESPPALPRPTQSARSPVQKALLKTGLVGAAVVVPAVPVSPESDEIVSVDHNEEFSQEITKETIAQHIEISDDSNQQFDMDDSSSAPKSSPENVNLESDSSPSGPDVHEDESRASGSAVMETSGSESNSSSRMDIVKENICSETDTTETVSLESQLSQKTCSDMEVSGSDTTEKTKLSQDFPMETDSAIQVSGGDTTEKMDLSEDSTMKSDSGLQVPGSGPAKTIGITDELSPSKTSSDIKNSVTGTTGSTGLQGSSPSKSIDTETNTTERRRVPFSPKRKSPTKLEYSSPKKSCQSPDKKQSESQMSTLLEELDITETENNTESSEPRSEQEQETSSERIVTDEPENENENENEDEMEVQETDFQTESEKNDEMSEK